MKFEEEIAQFYKENNIAIINTCESNKTVDFLIENVFIDAKEKTKTSNHWTKNIPAKYIIILDELSVMRCLNCGLQSGFVIKDNINKIYYFMPIIDVIRAKKELVNRPIEDKKGKVHLKGKWILDLRDFKSCTCLYAIHDEIKKYSKMNLLQTNKIPNAPVKGSIRNWNRRQQDTYNYRTLNANTETKKK